MYRIYIIEDDDKIGAVLKKIWRNTASRRHARRSSAI